MYVDGVWLAHNRDGLVSKTPRETGRRRVDNATTSRLVEPTLRRPP